MFKLKDSQEIENFIKVANESRSMSHAASVLNFKTFMRIAKELNCYKPNQAWSKNKSIKNETTFIKNRKNKLNEILNGKFPEYQPYKLKSLLFEFGMKKNVCERCGLSNWRRNEDKLRAAS